MGQIKRAGGFPIEIETKISKLIKYSDNYLSEIKYTHMDTLIQTDQTLIRWIFDRNRNTNKQAYYIQLSYFYIIKISKLYVISLLILVSISIGNPPIDVA